MEGMVGLQDETPIRRCSELRCELIDGIDSFPSGRIQVLNRGSMSVPKREREVRASAGEKDPDITDINTLAQYEFMSARPVIMV